MSTMASLSFCDLVTEKGETGIHAAVTTGVRKPPVSALIINNSALNILSFFMQLCKSLLVDFCVCLDQVLHIRTPGFLGKALAQKSEFTFMEVFC